MSGRTVKRASAGRKEEMIKMGCEFAKNNEMIFIGISRTLDVRMSFVYICPDSGIRVKNKVAHSGHYYADFINSEGDNEVAQFVITPWGNLDIVWGEYGDPEDELCTDPITGEQYSLMDFADFQ